MSERALSPLAARQYADGANSKENYMDPFIFPQFDPVALAIGPLVIRWYALAYIAGIALGYIYLSWLDKKRPFFGDKPREDLVLYAVLGIVLGGRIGYVLFYQFDYYFAHPLEIAQIWQGGMAFHGGFIGVLAAFYLFARRYKLTYLRVLDRLAIVTPLGLFFGRIANFINGELVGRIALDSPFAMIFPDTDGAPRHPSQLYQAFGEGLVLWLIMLVLVHRTKALEHEGRVGGAFVMGYGVFRFLAEFFREPDVQLGYLVGGLSMGQLLCVPMIVLGAWLIYRSRGRLAA